MTMRKKLLITIACLSVVLCTLVTGTLAWLISTSGPIINTFEPSKIMVGINESSDLDLQMVPGKEITKDPAVYLETNIACYVFVEITEDLGAWDETNEGDVFADYFSYSVEDGWTALDGYPGVYYCNAEEDIEGLNVLVDDVITVKGETVTMAMMQELINGGNKPTLTFTAYAIQSENLPYGEATEESAKALVAWNILNGNN